MKTQMNSFLKFVVMLALGSSLGACTKNSEINLRQPLAPIDEGRGPDGNPEDQEEGGISAGGGGTLPANPINVYEVRKVIESAKMILRLSFNYNRLFPPRKELLGSSQFFYGEKNLATQLEITDLEVLDDKPCKNKFGRDVDASIYASRPNTICLSAFRIAPKLIKEIAMKEILALLAHELSHFLGANEKQAVEVQRDVAWDLSQVGSNPADIENKLFGVPMYFSQLEGYRSRIEDEVKAGNISEIQNALYEISKTLSEVNSLLPSTYINLMDYKISDFNLLIYSRIRLAQLFLATLAVDPNYPEDQLSAIENYKKCFGDAIELTAAEMGPDCTVYFDKDNIYPFYKFQKLTDLSQLSANLDDVFQLINDLGGHIRALAFNYPIPYFKLPSLTNEANPWLKFQGQYTITEKMCVTTYKYNSFEQLESITIQPGTLNYPVKNTPIAVMIEKGNGMTSWYNIGNGADTDAMYVFSGDNWASVEESRGDRWYNRQLSGWTRTTKTIRLENDQLILDMKFETAADKYDEFKEDHFECRFKLELAQ